MKKKYWIVLAVLLVVLIGASGYLYLNTNTSKMTYSSFLNAVNHNQVSTVIFSDNSNTFKAKISTDKDKTFIVPNPKTENFVEFLLTHGINVSYSQDSLLYTLLRIGALLLVTGGIIWFTRRQNNSKSLIIDATKSSDKNSLITLDQVAGNVEAKSMVEDIIQFIKDPDKYLAVGARMPRGLLFYGPPGTGKTLMAKAIAGEASVPFYAMSGSDFVQMYVGVGASRIRNLFHKAKKSEKAVIFIDEIDAIGKKRARNLSASNDERDQTLNALLTEMSGFNDSSGVVVIAATNRLDTLDEALLRPGRFDRQIEIGLPDIHSREKILKLHARTKPLSDDVDLKSLAKSTVCFSGAMLENLLNEAAIYAANENQTVIEKSHMDKAFYTVIAGAPKQDRSFISQRDRNITAFHEAGHALTTALLLPEHFISKVTIIPSVKGAGGYNLSIPSDTLYQTQKQMKSNMQVLLAGRVAEELIFGESEITTGASNDIQKVSALVLDYINKYGMEAEFGLFSTQALNEIHDAELIRKCRELMNVLYEETRKLVEANLLLLNKIATELLDKESLDGTDIARICADNNS